MKIHFSKDEIISLLTVITVALFLFIPNLMNGFINGNEYDAIFNDPLLMKFSFQNIFDIFKSHFSFEYNSISPITFLSYLLDRSIFGHNPYIYHLTQTLMHFLNIILVFIFTHLLFKKPRISFLTSLFFAIHPFNIEAVACLSARSEVLYVMFLLIAIILYQRSEDSRTYRTLSLLSFMISLMTSVHAAILPLILLLIDYQKRGDVSTKDILDKLSYILLSLAFFLLGYWAVLYAPQLTGALSQQSFSFSYTLGFYFSAIFHYVSKLILPAAFCGEYPLSAIVNQNALPGIILFIFVGLLISQKSLRSSRNTLFCLFFFLLTILPSLLIASLKEPQINDRFVYLPSVGIFMLLAWIVRYFTTHSNPIIFRTRFIIITGLIVFIGVQLLQSYSRIKIWRNGETFWSDVILKNPDMTSAYMKRGNFYLGDDKPLFALKDFRRAIEIAPDLVAAHKNIGHTYLYMGNLEQAENSYATAILLEPIEPSHYTDRGNVAFLLKEYDIALEDYNMALQLDPDHTASRMNRGVLFQIDKQYEKALDDFYHVLNLDPANRMAIENITKIESMLGLP